MTRSTSTILVALALLAGAGASAQDGFCMVNGTTTGGAAGPTIIVTNGTDFITQATTTAARIIQVDGVLTIGSVNVRSDKTIVGLGTNATLLGRLSISGVSNVIVQNLRITSPGDDGISVRDPNTHHVWVDHVTFYDCGDGSCDMSQGADYVTVSWCKFIYPTQLEHRFTMIADGTVTGEGHITLHHNWWSTRADQRMAATSYGRIHYYNNYFNCTNNSYCSNARIDAELNIENNYYAGVKDPVGISSGTNGKIKTSGNSYPGCTGTIHPGTDIVFIPPYAYTLDATVNVPSLVMAGAGAPGSNTIPIPPKIWDGGGANNSLNTSINWKLNESPKEYDTLILAGTTRLTPNNNYTANSEFPSLSFSNDAGAFVLTGNTLNLGVGITNDSAAVQTINLNLDFFYGADHYTTNRFFNVSSPNGSLVINGRIAGVTSSYGRNYAVTKFGPGLLTFAGINTFPGALHLNGGLVRFSTLDTNLPGGLGSVSHLNFNGGGLQWAPGNTADISVRVIAINAAGATLDVGANDVTFANSLGGGAGSLTKSGAGKLTLNGNNGFSGVTLINQGTLALGTAGSIPNSSQIILTNDSVLDATGRSDGTLSLGSGKALRGNGSVLGNVTAASGATVFPGFSIGTLVVSGTLTFQAGSTNVMELNATTHTNDLITGLTTVNYGGRLVLTNLSGTLAAGDIFKLFDAGTYNGDFTSIGFPVLTVGLIWTNKLAADGTIAVVSSVNTTPPNIAMQNGGADLVLSWPADHTGWRLEVQTNLLSAGLGTNWFTVPGSSGTNQMSLPVDSTSQSIFYRLVYP